MQTNPKGNDQILVRYLLCKGKTTTSILDKTQNITLKQQSHKGRRQREH